MKSQRVKHEAVQLNQPEASLKHIYHLAFTYYSPHLPRLQRPAVPSIAVLTRGPHAILPELFSAVAPRTIDDIICQCPNDSLTFSCH